MTEDVRLSEYLAAFAGASVAPSAGAGAMLKLSLFDWAVCGIAGAGEQVARILRDLGTHEGGLPEATAIGADQALPARMAAMINGTTSHALDYDDTHFAHIGHPSVAVFPAALAMAEAEGADMTAFRDAALFGAEASIRAGLWLGRSHYQAGFHQTGTAGAIGAAVAAARVKRLPESDATQAFGLLGTRASGLKSQFGTMGKPFNAGLAAANGVEAVLLAARGFEGALDGLDGAQGFGPTHAGAGDESAFDGAGSQWLFESVSHKFHACCHGLHAMIEAIRALGDVVPGEVSSVTVHTHPRWASVCNIAAPVTGLEAKFSYRLVAAMALSGVPTEGLQSYSVETASDPGLVRLRDLVTVAFDATLAETETRVIVATPRGERASAHDLAAPIAPAEREARLKAKANTLLGPNLAARVWEVTQADNLRDLTRLLRG